MGIEEMKRRNEKQACKQKCSKISKVVKTREKAYSRLGTLEKRHRFYYSRGRTGHPIGWQQAIESLNVRMLIPIIREVVCLE